MRSGGSLKSFRWFDQMAIVSFDEGAHHLQRRGLLDPEFVVSASSSRTRE
jgi:hypothetical protein